MTGNIDNILLGNNKPRKKNHTEEMIKGYERAFANKEMNSKAKEIYTKLLNKLNKQV